MLRYIIFERDNYKLTLFKKTNMMNKQKNMSFLLISIIFTLVSCTPKADTLMSNDLGDDEYIEKNVDPTQTEKVATFGRKNSVNLDKGFAKKMISKRFNDVQAINNIEIQQFKNTAPYYLTAKGKKNGEAVLVAMELLRKGEELHTSEYNTLHTACIAKACNACSFSIDKNGEIMDCRCEETKNTPEAISPCEHRTFIKTLEKNF